MVREAAGPDFPLYAGVSAFRTKDAIKLAKAAADNHYQAIMLGFPPYRIPLQSQALAYAKDVCAAVPDTCVFAYNCPQCTGFDLAVDTFVEMVSQIPNIHGIKEVGNSSSVPAILEKTPRPVTALTGFDLCIVPQFKMGYSCITSMAANVFPETMRKIVDSVKSGDYESALSELATVEQAMTLIEKNSFSPCVKYILRKRGVPAGFSPLPLCEPSADVLKQLDGFVDVA